jgi:cytoskeletal protein CcmA (bactofilin family)
MGWFSKGADGQRPDGREAERKPAQPEVSAVSALVTSRSPEGAPPEPSTPRTDVAPRAAADAPPRPEPARLEPARSPLSSLFARPSTTTGPQGDAVPGKEDQASVFSQSVDIEGSLEGEGDVVLEGRVRGSISITGALFVGQTGSVQADVSAREVVNAGTIEGNLHAAEKVRVQATGVVHGDIDSPSIVIDDGGGVEGFVQMQPPGGEEDLDAEPPLPGQATVAAPSVPASGFLAPRTVPPAGGRVDARGATERSPMPDAVQPRPLAGAADPLAVFFDEAGTGVVTEPVAALLAGPLDAPAPAASPAVPVAPPAGRSDVAPPVPAPTWSLPQRTP